MAEQICQEIDKVKNSKKGVADWAKKTLYTLMNNPIPKIVEGEDRVLRGYKIQLLLQLRLQLLRLKIILQNL